MNLLHKTGILLMIALIVLFAWDIYLYYRPKEEIEEDKNKTT